MEQFHRHHPWPKYLGGPEEQILERLPRSLHEEYHRGIDQFAKRSPRGTKSFENLSPAARKKIFEQILEYTKEFDAKHGTGLYEATVRNNFPGMQ